MSGILAIYDSNGVLVWDTAGTNKKGERFEEFLDPLGSWNGRVPLVEYGKDIRLELKVCPGSNTISRHCLTPGCLGSIPYPLT